MANVFSTVPTMLDLRGFIIPEPEPGEEDNYAVYVQGYKYPSDGGGGMFVYRKYVDDPYQEYPPLTLPNVRRPVEDYGIYIESFHAATKLKGIWIRQFSGDIDIRYYGVLGQSEDVIDGYGTLIPASTPTQRIQNAIDYASESIENVNNRKYGQNRSNTVFIPNGSYKINQLVLKKGVTLKGSSKKNVIFIDPGTNADPMITIAPGPVTDVHVSGISFHGTGSSYQKFCISIIATPDEGGSGGMWESSFRDIHIMDFKGTAIEFRGGTNKPLGGVNYFLVNQFIVFEGVYVEGTGHLETNNIHHALSIAGLNAQFSFNNCRFDGGSHLFGDTDDEAQYDVNGINVYIGLVSSTDTVTPTNINFNTCTFQNGAVGIWMESCRNINIYGSWFENMEKAIVVQGTKSESKGINIMNNCYGRSAGRYGNPEDYDDNTGSIITYNNAQLNVLNNYVADADEGIGNGVNEEKVRFISLEPDANGDLKNLGVNTFGNSFLRKDLNNSYGIKKDIILSFPESEIKTENARVVYLINNTAQTKTIDEVTSFVSAGEIICIKAQNGSVKFTESKNLYLGNMNNPGNLLNGGNVTINNGGWAMFVKVDEVKGTFYETYHLITYKNKV